MRHRGWPTSFALVVVLVAACSAPNDVVGPFSSLVDTGSLAEYKVWTGQGSDSLRCDKLGESPERSEDGWMHWILTRAGDVSEAKLLLGGSGGGAYEPSKYGPVVEFFTPSFDIFDDGGARVLDAVVNYDGSLPNNAQFTLSDYCPGVAGRSLEITKTAEPEFTRTHAWKVVKSVAPDSVYLYVDGYLPDDASPDDASPADAVTWTVAGSYLGFEDSAFALAGTITIQNGGLATKTITEVEDTLFVDGVDEGIAVDIDACWLADETADLAASVSLEPGAILTCTYRHAFGDELPGKGAGSNEVTVTVAGEDAPYRLDPPASWAFDLDAPTTEMHASVDVVDESDLLGTRTLGTLVAPDGGTFTYDQTFAWTDYGQDKCGEHAYHNTATLLGDDAVSSSATATVAVHVQCFLDETAWAADGEAPGAIRYVGQGNWATFVRYDPESPEAKTSTIFAGQTHAVGTATFSPPEGGEVTIVIELEGGTVFADGKETLKVQDYAQAPEGNPDVGLFEHKWDATATSISVSVPQNAYYGVHLDVWMPDPAFGPEPAVEPEVEPEVEPDVEPAAE